MSWTKALITASAAATLLLGGCSKSNPGESGPGNLPPDTFLSHAPAEGDTTSYRVRMDWYGWDADGYVSHFRVRLDTLEWVETSATESVFVLPAGGGGSDGECSYEPHTVAVAAVDNHETPDPTPASISFTASTVLPETEIIRAPPPSGGPVASIEWLGSDSDGTVAGYEYRFSEWIGRGSARRGWIELESSGFLGPDEVTVVFDSLDGRYLFEVWSTDDVGGVDPTPAEWDFQADPAFSGAVIQVESNVIDFHSHWQHAPFYRTIQVFGGEHLTFTWWASAEQYGGEVTGYRHAYDDTIPWPEWSLDETHFEVTATPGEHRFFVQVLDNSGAVRRWHVDLDVVETPLDDYVLLVDDYNLWEHNPQWGSDDARNLFYELLLSDCARPVHEWEPSEHPDDEGRPQPPDVEALSRASTVVWYTDGEQTVLRALFDPYQGIYNQLGGYMRVGGNLVLCGFKNSWQISGEPYPVRTLDAETAATQFVRDYLHIDYVDNSGTAANKSAPGTYGYCFYGAVPVDAGSFSPMYVDSVGTGGYPEPGKWPVYTWEQPNYSRGGLPQVEILSPASGAVPIFRIDAFLNTRFGGRSCGVLYLTGDNHGNVCYFGFPLYYLQTEQVGPVIGRVMELFGEEMAR